MNRRPVGVSQQLLLSCLIQVMAAPMIHIGPIPWDCRLQPSLPSGGHHAIQQ
jgi:hypothetical protein